MKRRLFTILSALSLLLSVAVVVMCVRSYYVHDVVVLGTRDRSYQMSSMGGKLWLFDHEQRLTGVPMPLPYVGQYPLAPIARERGEAMSELIASASDAAAAEARFASLASLLEAGNDRRREEMPEAERAVHRARERQMRAVVRWQAAKATGRGDSRAGFMWYAGDGRTSRFAATPYWCLFAIAALAPAAQLLLRLHRRRRARGGLCAACGYDLRATPGRCPECGTTRPTSAG